MARAGYRIGPVLRSGPALDRQLVFAVRPLSTSAVVSSIRSAVQRKIAMIDSETPPPHSFPSLVLDPPPSTATPAVTGRSLSSPLVDSFGRKHDYLRISLTEKCNLRCTYCMPSTGVPLLPRDELLTTDEIERVAKLFVEHGVRKIRLTGGEPTVRKDLVEVVARLAALKPQIDSLGITSNGVTLRRHLPGLVDAGLTHLNISLDTLDEHKYELMTRRRAFGKVMETLEVAKRLRDGKGLKVKLNVVIIKGLNDMEVPQFVEMTRSQDLVLRFIEYMPFEDNRWSTKKLVPSKELLSQLEAQYSDIDKLEDSPSDTTRAYRVRGYQGSFGFISSMTDHFCGTCSRLRVGADGGVKVCLFGAPALALRPLIRALPSNPENDTFIAQKIGAAVWGKKFAHNGLGARRQSDRTTRTLAPTIGRSNTLRPDIRSLLSLQSPPRSSARVIRLFSTSSALSTTTPTLSHIDPRTGKASMVDVSPKTVTLRTATAKGKIYLNRIAFSLIDLGSCSSVKDTPTMQTKKGDVLSVAQLAGLMAAKQTSSLIPLCHPLSLSHLSVSLLPSPSDCSIEITCRATCEGKTGVEMEALTGVSIAGLTVWDMCKSAAGEEMRLGDIRVVEKTGGRSGDWTRESDCQILQRCSR